MKAKRYGGECGHNLLMFPVPSWRLLANAREVNCEQLLAALHPPALRGEQGHRGAAWHLELGLLAQTPSDLKLALHIGLLHSQSCTELVQLESEQWPLCFLDVKVQSRDGEVEIKLGHIGMNSLLLLFDNLWHIQDNSTDLFPPNELTALGADARHSATEATL